MKILRAKPTQFAPGPAGFYQWMRKRDPRNYQRVKRAMGGALGDVDPFAASPATGRFASILQSVIASAKDVYTTKAQIDAQKKVYDIQLARAQQGLSPLDISPTGGVVQSGPNWILWGALGLAALWILKR